LAQHSLNPRSSRRPKPRLAALVPNPRVKLTRYHGVLAPNHRWRGRVTPAKRGKGVKRTSTTEVRSPAERQAAMTWAQRLKRVFNIDKTVIALDTGSHAIMSAFTTLETS
jgi:hypothetical protein